MKNIITKNFQNPVKTINILKGNIKDRTKRRNFLIISEILLGGVSTITTSILSNVSPSVGVFIASSTALLTSTAILITKENIPKLKIRFTKLRDWMNVIILLYEKTLTQCMVDQKICEKEALVKKKIYNHNLDQRKAKRKITQINIEDIYGDIIGQDIVSRDQIMKLNIFVSQNELTVNVSTNINLFKPRKENYIDIQPSAPPGKELSHK